MPNPLYVGPDALLALLQYLRSVSGVTSVIPGNKIVTSIPPTGTEYPYVLIGLGGGSGTTLAVEKPVYQIDVMGGSKEQCGLIARTIKAAILAIANDTVDEAVLSSGVCEVGLTWLPDTLAVPPLSRYTSRYRVTLHR